jgi:selT/selW/selH-like putative selenoprotein
VEFEILYCKPCGYLQRAEDLAAELRKRFEARVSIEEGKFGQFDVLLDGKLVASKGKFLRRMLIHGAPPQSELIESIERHLSVQTGDACELPASGERR